MINVSQTRVGYTKEWLGEDRVLCYRLHNLTIETIDAWATDLINEFANWPIERPWRLMLDIRLRGSIVGAYALRRAREIARMRPELAGRLSVLVASKLAVDIINIAIRATNNTYRRRLVFTNETAALAWLLDDK